MFHKNLALIVLPLCFIACDKVKKLDNMAKATNNLEKQTNEMAKNTGNTDTMYKQLRAKEAAATRLDEFNNLMNPNTKIESKITSAGCYFKAQEYQLATEDELRDPHIMDILKNDAANDFIRKAGDLYENIKIKNLDPTKNMSKHNNEAAFNALATAMHLNHHHQDMTAEKVRKKTVSMYDMVKAALRQDKIESDLKAGGKVEIEYSSYEQILVTGKRKEILIELIKARVDMLSAIALKFMTDKRDMELSQFMKGLSFMISGGRLGAIDLPVTINDANGATKKTVIEALDGALKAKRFLNQELKVEKKLVKTLRSAFKQLKVETEGDRALEDISKRIEELLQ